MSIVIYHNSDCGTSRNVLAIAQASGEEVTVIDYLDTGWTRAQLLGLFAAAGLTPKSALRRNRSPAEELGLLDSSIDNATVLLAMLEHPILVERPIVCSPKGVRLCRPAEQVFDLLECLPEGPFYKENGEMIINEHGSRVS